jgi:hypothetical protein
VMVAVHSGEVVVRLCGVCFGDSFCGRLVFVVVEVEMVAVFLLLAFCNLY